MATWNLPFFLGTTRVVASALSMGVAVDASRSSASGLPAHVHVSGSNVTATGVTNPFMHVEFTHEVVDSPELGVHMLNCPWRLPLVAGTIQSALVDTHLPQRGAEAVFRFSTAGVYTIRQTARVHIGDGLYLTGTSTHTFTVTAHTNTSHWWFDADAGNDAHDGRDPWGFGFTGGTLSGANVAVGLYEIVGKDSDSQIRIRIAQGDERTLTKSNAFISYDHAAATSPTDVLCRYNFIYLTAGTAAGGISASTGPKQAVAASNVASNRTLHFKGGNTTLHTAPSGLTGDTGVRFVSYGVDRAKMARLTILSNNPGDTCTDVAFHRIRFDTAGVSGRINVNVTTGATAPSPADHLLFSDCDMSDTVGAKSLIVTGPGSNDATGFCAWNCLFISPLCAESAIFLKHGEWSSIVGGEFSGLGRNNNGRDHHIYPAVRGHFLAAYIKFGDGPLRNYCINTDAGGAEGLDRLYWNIRDCLMSGTERAWDASHGGGDENCYLSNVVCEFNVVTNLSGSQQVLFYHCRSMMVRFCVFYSIAASRAIQPGTPDQSSLEMWVCNNKFYHGHTSASPQMELSYTIPACRVYDNEWHDIRTTNAIVISCDFSAHLVDGNRLYTPNNSGSVATNTAGGVSVNRTFSQYQSGVDAGALNTSPGWGDPANGVLIQNTPVLSDENDLVLTYHQGSSAAVGDLTLGASQMDHYRLHNLSGSSIQIDNGSPALAGNGTLVSVVDSDGNVLSGDHTLDVGDYIEFTVVRSTGSTGAKSITLSITVNGGSYTFSGTLTYNVTAPVNSFRTAVLVAAHKVVVIQGVN